MKVARKWESSILIVMVVLSHALVDSYQADATSSSLRHEEDEIRHQTRHRADIYTEAITSGYDPLRHVIYVASIDRIIKLDASDVTNRLGEIVWESDRELLEACSEFMGEKENPNPTREPRSVRDSGIYKCRNHVTVINQLNATHMYACATYSFNPQCCFVNLQNFSLMIETCSTTMWRAPYNSDAEVYVDVHRHQVVTATYGGFYGDDPFISITSLDQQLRTKEDRYFLNEPHFAGVYIKPTLSGRSNKAYVFFHEIAKERKLHLHGESPYRDEQQVTSRVATVCLNDRGGNIWILSKRITSLEKMTLLCSAKIGKYSTTYLHFTNVVDTKLIENPNDKNDPLVVALFRRGRYDGGSAVCVYKFKEIQHKFETRRFYRHDADSKENYHETDRYNEEECSGERLTDRRLRWKKNHLVKVGFITPKYWYPLYYTEKDVFTSLTIHKDLINTPTGTHLLLRNDEEGLVRRVFIQSTDLINDNGRRPYVTTLPDVIMKGERVTSALQTDDDVIITTTGGVEQLRFPGCESYQDCVTCTGHVFCLWSRGSCLRSFTFDKNVRRPKCEPISAPPTTPPTPKLQINADVWREKEARAKQLRHDIDSCRRDLKHMKEWHMGEMTKYDSLLKREEEIGGNCSRRFIKYSRRCADMKNALVRKNQIVKRKLMTSEERLKRELAEVKEKSALQCEEKQKNCDCSKPETRYESRWSRDNRTGNLYLVGDSGMSFAAANRFCVEMNSQLPEINEGGFMKELVGRSGSRWSKYWIGYTSDMKKETSVRQLKGKHQSDHLSPQLKCLQLVHYKEKNFKWSFEDCEKLATPVCRRAKEQVVREAALKMMNSVASSHLNRLN